MNERAPTPRYATIPDFMALSGLKRTGVYRLLAEEKLRAKKLGAKTLIDVEHGLAFLASLPPATIRAPRKAA